MSASHGILATIRGIALVGLDPREVQVEASLAPGLPGLRLIGLPDAAVREAGDRVKVGLQRRGFRWPQERLVVNLAPADLPKAGSSFDLPLALAVLVATGVVPAADVADVWACGEVGLDGTLKPVAGTLALTRGARALGARRLLVPAGAAAEAALVEGIDLLAVHDLAEVVEVVSGRQPARAVVAAGPVPGRGGPDLADVRGQPVARRAVEIAAAGAHHLLLSGPPGCGKTMLAQRLRGVLPALPIGAAMDVAAIHSLAGERAPNAPLSLVPPLREPHHSTSTAGLVGGGSGVPGPGELSLAHNGVLLLDELLETPRHVLDALRQPLERGEVVITRARARVRYPARVLLVAATNPCPCGNLGGAAPCRCRPDRVERYRARLSGPLLDRLDLHVELRPVERSRLTGPPDGERSDAVAVRVQAARTRAIERFGDELLPRDVPGATIRPTCRGAALAALGRGIEQLGASARAFDRCLRVARTIADLADAELVDSEHVEESLAYRLPSLAAQA